MLCPGMGELLRVLILVTSAPGHFSKRQSIRETWGTVGQRTDVALGFFLGASFNETTEYDLDRESATYGDLIRGNSMDTYENLTLKSLSMLEWTVTYCPMTPYLLKTDDDMFLNMKVLLEFMEDHSEDTERIFGHIAKNWAPHRDLESKWYVPEESFKNAMFPDFVTGPIYLLTGDILLDLYTTALKTTFLWLEDVFLTGFVAEQLKIPRKDIGKVIKRIDAGGLLPCNLAHFVAIHDVDITEQFDFWYHLNNPQTLTNCTVLDSKKSAEKPQKQTMDDSMKDFLHQLKENMKKL
ncbi:beta-1,3-galactosyltransferase 2-like [Phlebotomus papatasi]|uniref:beta-1,3-galactosyltransferase 2-like n=1 Tax=Phlebotomus papatasi TaxID=29031 RepID=UPI0024843C8F|nr:beta-1,3-galactosyltransferase 2-like [Phlebotomus papatasi]